MRLTLVDHAQAFTPTERATLLTALNVQLAEFAVVWDLALSTISDQPGGYELAVLHDADQAGALGYHATTPQGQPYARVFSGPVLSHGGGTLTGGTIGISVASVVSHEALELILDPAANRWVRNGNRLLALEACDAVQGRTVRYQGVDLSDYVLPAWCDPGATGPYAHSTPLTRPFATGRGGYQIIARATGDGQITAAIDEYGTPDWRRPGRLHPAARTARRLAEVQR